jgi:glycosyltransferase involved in cell wall biosynthesis
MSVSIVVPCYRSASTLPDLVNRLLAVMPAVAPKFEVILVVDGSPDNTWDVARDLAARHGPTRAIRLARNYGQHNALIAGVRAARYDVVVTMDDDLQHPPEEVPKLLAALTEDLDLVYGLSEQEEHNFFRNVSSQLIKAGLSNAVGVPNARQLSAFRAFRTFLRGSFDQVVGPHVSVDVCLSWTTTRIGGVTVQMVERAEGRSNYTLRSLAKAGFNMILGYSTLPLRLVTYLGFIVGLGGLALLIRVMWLYLTHGTTVAGYTSIASMIAIFSSAQMIGIGVLGEYVGRIHAAGMGRPTYVVRERAEGSDPNLARDLAEILAGEPAIVEPDVLADEPAKR